MRDGAFVMQTYVFVMQMYKAGNVIDKQMAGHGWPAKGDKGQRDAEIRNDGR